MTDRERQLILGRLFDRGLLPWEGNEIDATTWETLSDQEREVFAEEIAKEAERLQAEEVDVILRMEPKGSSSRFTELKLFLWSRWRSLRMAWAKKGARAK
jgi:hypothetical protein